MTSALADGVAGRDRGGGHGVQVGGGGEGGLLLEPVDAARRVEDEFGDLGPGGARVRLARLRGAGRRPAAPGCGR